MTCKLVKETFSQKTEHFGGVIFVPLTPLFSFVTFHLKSNFTISCEICTPGYNPGTNKTMCPKANRSPWFLISTGPYTSLIQTGRPLVPLLFRLTAAYASRLVHPGRGNDRHIVYW